MPKRHPVVDRTYRLEDGPVNYWNEAVLLLGCRIVVYIPQTGRWKTAWLVGVLPSRDTFVVRWTRRGKKHVKSGIWRVHRLDLFEEQRIGQRLLPIPLYRSKLPESTNNNAQEGSMATSKTTASKKPAKKPAAQASDSNGAASRTTNDKLAGLSDAKRRNIAKLITRERAKKPATSWPDIITAVEAKYDWTLPGSMTGRKLMREYGPDGAEEAIIKQERSATGTKRTKKTKLSPAEAALAEMDRNELKVLNKDEELGVRVVKSMSDDDLRAAIAAAGWEPATDEEEDEEDTEEDEDEDEEDEATDEVDEDEDEDEEEEPAPKPAAKKVAVKRGAAKPKAKPKAKPNPSK